MSQASVFSVKNRLAAAMKRPGGKLLTDMLQSAERRVATLRDDSVRSLDAQIERLRKSAEAGREGTDAKALDTVYAAANEVFAVSAAFGLTVVSDAAYELCDLADHFRETGEVNWQVIEVFVDGLRLLVAGGQDAGAASTVLAGLRGVRARFVTDA